LDHGSAGAFRVSGRLCEAPGQDFDELCSIIVAGDEHRRSSLRLENRRFTYEDLEMITNNFQRVIGRGGFGYVYEGFLEDGTQVAVKIRSQSSNQGAKEFLTEVAGHLSDACMQFVFPETCSIYPGISGSLEID